MCSWGWWQEQAWVDKEHVQKTGQCLWARKKSESWTVLSPMGEKERLPPASRVHFKIEKTYKNSGFRKDRRTRDQIANICWSSKKQESSRKTSTFALLAMPKPLTMWITKKLWKILKQMRMPGHLTCLLRNMYAGQEAAVRTGHGTTDWFQIGKGLCQGYILSPCLFNLYAEYIMRNARLSWSQDCQEKYQ